MTLDKKLRARLIEARENIGAHLVQLEGAAVDTYAEGGMPDCREVYADLQRKLHEIDTLLEGDGGARNVSDGQPTYEPMVRWNPDGTVGNPTGPTRAAIIMAIVSLGLIILSFGVALLVR